MLVFARVIYPGSKKSSLELSQMFLEKPGCELHQVYRALEILSKENDFFQSQLYKNSEQIMNRRKGVLYYDCTNYYFEIEKEDDFRKYGHSKEHRPNPIVQMGLFMDADGIPLTFSVFNGNENEQPSMKPLEQKIIRDFGIDKVIVCTDGGLGSEDNRLFNDIEGRAFIVTQSLKKLKAEEREAAMSDSGWRRLSDNKPVDLSEIRENPEQYRDCLYYKEEPYGTKKVPGQIMYVTYSPKYALYQKNIRSKQIERASELIKAGKKNGRRNNPNDPARFVRKISVTKDGEAADKTNYSLDTEKIENEAMYDGYYAVCTNLVEDSAKAVLEVSEGRWEIEESFRIMKTDFEARPVHLSREDRIRAHFLICYLALLIFRLLEKKLNSKYTSSEIISTLRKMSLMGVEGYGFQPSYTRTDLTDELHEKFGFYTDYQILKKSLIRSIIRQTKDH